MAFANVVVDIPTRALKDAFSYEIPPELEAEAQVGATVLVSFAGRKAVGYVISTSDTLTLERTKIRPIEQLLAASAFDEKQAELALWMAREYACPLAEALRPFLAPGQKLRVTRKDESSPWELVNEKAGAVDVRWVRLGEGAKDFVPAKNASRQREVIAALSEGPVRLPELAAMISGAASVVQTLEKRGVVLVEKRRQLRGSEQSSLSSATAPRPKNLTQGQKDALDQISQALTRSDGSCVLLDGVTGSGKTEVYLEAIEQVLHEGKSALVLVPEISLTAQTLGRFRSRFGDAVAVLHSRLSVGERFDQWDLARQGVAKVVVGARSALFAPVHNLGLIVIDEEHEYSYKQDQAPRYHARETAFELARLKAATLVLGSATPSFESLLRARQGSYKSRSWTRVAMPERPGIARLPQVHVVNMADEFNSGERSIFSRPLAEALVRETSRNKKAVLLLNRRGFANFLMCRECGCVPECPHCSQALTYHERDHALVCHACGRSFSVVAYPNPMTKCPNCGGRYLGAFGVGTQRVEDELKLLLPDVEIIRMDFDTTRTKDAHQKLLERFDAATSAVLIGTQMIAKGLDFPDVTLVGVINADTMLKLPDFRSAERSYDLLEQVSGRAGRGEEPGEVFIQSWWAKHPAIVAAARHDRSRFEELALAERQEANYPPYSRLANCLFWGNSSPAVRACSAEFAELLAEAIQGKEGYEMLGPADCVKAKLKDKYRRHVMLKAPEEAALGELLSACAEKLSKHPGVSVALDVDAYDLM